MAAPQITKRQLAGIRKDNAAGLNDGQIARKRGINHTTVTKHRLAMGLKACGRIYMKKVQASGPPLASDVERGNERDVARVVSEPIRTLEQLVKVCEVDTDTWEVAEWTCNKWEVGAKIKQGIRERMVVTPLFQVKAKLKRKVELLDTRAEIERLKQYAFKAVPPAPAVAKPKPGPTGMMLEICLADLHLGKLAYGKETRGTNYDVKIAERIAHRAMGELLAGVAHHRFDVAVCIIGQDYLHSDTPRGETYAGTAVGGEMDGRFYKTFRTAFDVAVEQIQMLRKVAAQVHVMVVPGNHDTQSTWSLGFALEVLYRGEHNKDVTIDNSAPSRKYFKFHDCMLGVAHGDKGKHADYPLLLATDARRMFGETRFTEIHCGHLHRTQREVVLLRDVSEQHGVRVRILPALCATDAWHAQNGFVGNQRSSEAFVWRKGKGVVATAVYTETGE